jgi:Zn-finger nucleic acid-binding protein
MDCPIDGTTLQMTDRQGIEIDYCPQCRGVWLDRGELDKIIERSASWEPAAEPAPTGRPEKIEKAEKAEKPKKSKTKSFFETIMESVGEG